MVALPGVVIVGNHGLELLAGGRRELLGSTEGLDRVRAAVKQLRGDAALAATGVRLEDKGGSVALHTRGAQDEEGAWRVAVAAAQAAATAHGLALLPGRQVVDLRPPGVTKGSAVRTLIERNQLLAAVYAGDDRTDIDAFRALRALREDGLYTLSLAVVSPEAPQDLAETADLALSLPQVAEVLALLRDRAAAVPMVSPSTEAD
jgi:trehalose 6-phosphate phosphatase